jgi:hypothetical protein
MRLIDRRVHSLSWTQNLPTEGCSRLSPWAIARVVPAAKSTRLHSKCTQSFARGSLHQRCCSNLVPTLRQIIQDLNSDEVVDILKRFGQLISEPEEGMEDWNPGQFLQFCIDNRATNVSRRVVSPEEASRLFECYHVTITPTGQLLGGPIPETSNRVLRWYSDYQHHFLRVDFSEEDGNNIRLDREVDNATFVQERFGSVLKNGIKVAGRRFEFLAYSQSALREHAVWFISPFSTLHKLPRYSLLNDVDLRNRDSRGRTSYRSEYPHTTR